MTRRVLYTVEYLGWGDRKPITVFTTSSANKAAVVFAEHKSHLKAAERALLAQKAREHLARGVPLVTVSKTGACRVSPQPGRNKK